MKRPREAGAAAALVLAAAAAVVAIGAGAVLDALVAADEQRATAAADAAAHAAEVALLGSPFAGDLGAALLDPTVRCGLRPAAPPRGDADPGGGSALGGAIACRTAVAAAVHEAAADGAAIVSVDIGPDTRDVGRTDQPRLEAVVVAAIARREVPAGICDRHPPPTDGRSDVCWAEAASAAQAAAPVEVPLGGPESGAATVAAATGGALRERAVAVLAAEVRDGVHAGDLTADVEAIEDVVALSPRWPEIRRRLAAAGFALSSPSAALELASVLCAPSGGFRPGRDPLVPGDLVVYREAGGDAAVAPRWRSGMAVSSATIVVSDPTTRRLASVPVQAVSGAGPNWPPSLPGIVPASVHGCRVDPAVLGEPSPAGRAGEVALTDPRQAARLLRWVATTAPRPSPGPVALLGEALGRLGSGLGSVVRHGLEAVAGATLWLLGACGLAGAAAALWSWLGRTFDGRWLHTLLTALLLATVVVLAPGFGTAGLLLAGVAVAGLATGLVGADRLGVVGRLGAGAWATGGFVVGVLTGVEDSKRVSIGAVGLALLTDLTLVGKVARLGRGVVAGMAHLPLASRLAGWGVGVVHRLVGAVGVVGDLAMVRPLAWARVAGRLGPLLRVSAPLGPASPLLSPTLALTSDAASWTWRAASLPADVAGHLGDLATLVGSRDAATLARWERCLLGVHPARRAAVLRAALGHLATFGDLAHLHSGARTIGSLASGSSLATVEPLVAGPMSPVGDPLAGINLAPSPWGFPEG